MAGRKKRAPETAAPGQPETDASASVLVSEPVIQAEPVTATSDEPVAVDGEESGAEETVLRLVNTGKRPRYEPFTRQTIPSGGGVQIDPRHHAVVAANVSQINALAGAEVLIIQETKE